MFTKQDQRWVFHQDTLPQEAGAGVIRRVLADFPGVIISVSHDRLYLDQVCTRVLELTANGLTKQI